MPESGIPKPGPLTVHLKDDHMQYAITWFGLAFAVMVAFGVWWRGQRRRMTRLETREKWHFDPRLAVARLRTKNDFPEFE